jgi:O-antigen/teichoic acid export membrane protein
MSGWGILSIPVGMLCGTGLVLTTNIVASWIAVKGIIQAGSMGIDLKTVKELAESSVLLFIVRICNLVSTRSYGIVVAAVLSAPLVVVFELTRKASIMIVDVISRLPMSLFSGLSHMIGKGEKNKMRQITGVLFSITFLLSMLGAGGVILLNREFIHLWTGDRFFGGSLLNILLCIYAVVQLMNSVCYNVLFSSGCFKALTLAYACEAALQLILSITLGYVIGLNGIALGFVIAAVSAMVIQGVKVMSLFDYNIFDRHFLGSTIRIVLTGCIPFVLGLLMSNVWTPRGWFGLSMFSIQYVIIGIVVLITVNASLRRKLHLLIRQ